MEAVLRIPIRRLPRRLFEESVTETGLTLHPDVLRDDFEWVPGMACIAVKMPLLLRFRFVAELAVVLFCAEVPLADMRALLDAARWDMPSSCVYFPRWKFDDSAGT